MTLYVLTTRGDHKSPWVTRYEGTDYRTAQRMRKHYKSKNYLTSLTKKETQK